MYSTTTITIAGYEANCNCEHCGRSLKHGIRVDDGRVVGAQCFDKVLTKAKIWAGKKFRVGSENIIRYAKAREKYNDGALARFGIHPHTLVFEKA